MKKTLIIYLFLFFLQSCGYSPIFKTNKKYDFFIEEIQFNEGDRDTVNFIKTNLNNYYSSNDGKKFKINADVIYQKNILSKNSTGEIEEYELQIIVNFYVKSEKVDDLLTFNESLKMTNFSDEFEERQYERTAKQSMSRSLTSKLLTRLSRYYDN